MINFGWFIIFDLSSKKFNQVVTGLQANYDAKKAPADDQKADKNKKKKWKKPGNKLHNSLYVKKCFDLFHKKQIILKQK